MAKKIVFHRCVHCPYVGYDEVRRAVICKFPTRHRHKRIIEDMEFIPDWCPLEDAEEQT